MHVNALSNTEFKCRDSGHSDDGRPGSIRPLKAEYEYTREMYKRNRPSRRRDTNRGLPNFASRRRYVSNSHRSI